jgi:hypothetical protein
MVNKSPTERRRGTTDTRGASFDFKSIFTGGKIGLELSLSAQDRDLISTSVDDLKIKVDEMTEKVDYRWKVTQWLMATAIALGAIGQVATFLMS